MDVYLIKDNIFIITLINNVRIYEYDENKIILKTQFDADYPRISYLSNLTFA